MYLPNAVWTECNVVTLLPGDLRVTFQYAPYCMRDLDRFSCMEHQSRSRSDEPVIHVATSSCDDLDSSVWMSDGLSPAALRRSWTR